MIVCVCGGWCLVCYGWLRVLFGRFGGCLFMGWVGG